MRKFIMTLPLLAGVILLPQRVAAQDAIGSAFAETLFAEETIAVKLREHPEVGELTKDQMNRILQARGVVSDFFQRLRGAGKGQVGELLSPELASAYRDRYALRRDRFGAEAYLSFEIIDFRISKDADEVRFRYFLTENDRGRAMLRQRAVTLRNAGGRWLIAEFDNFEFN